MHLPRFAGTIFATLKRMTARHVSLSLLSVGAALCITLAGCAKSQSVWDEYNPHPEQQHPARTRSLVTNSPRLDRAIAAADLDPDTYPWYAARNDRRLTTTDGQRSAIVEQSVTISHDRQSSTNGRVYDSTHNTTYRARVMQTIR